MTIFFTSDTHFGHSNIMKYCEETRGHFEDISHHDQTIVDNWNFKISPGDNVYHLGDFGFIKPEKLNRILNRLNGNIHLVLGNHDKNIKGEVKKKFIWVKEYYRLKVREDDNQNIILFHYPIASWHKAHHGAWHLHGHCHGTFPSTEFQARLDVGVDVHGMSPISYEEVKKHMSKKIFKSVDHHR